MYVVVGLGKTGVSCVRWLRARGESVRAIDTRDAPPGLAAVQAEFPDLEIHTGGLRRDWLDFAQAIVASPGVAVAEPEIAAAAAKGVPVIGDIELFARVVKAPVVGITGANGKSTVTALVGEMGVAAGLEVAVGGNYGTPALDLLADDVALYVLELSSFQLETTYSLPLAGGTILNLTEDHMDRYGSFAEYGMAKQRIYAHCAVAVVNRDDPWSAPRGEFSGSTISFGAGASAQGFGIAAHDGARWITRDGQLLVCCDDLRIKGTHNQLNAMAALGLGLAAGLPMDAMLRALKAFRGLPHRCRFVAEQGGVAWYNDSKGTNIGATAAALAGLGENIRGKVVLIAGGIGKDQDFRLLDPHVRAHVRNVVLIGQDAPLIRAALGEQAKLVDAQSMEEAVRLCAQLAQPGDAVLLSPACASFDMYTGYDQRGNHFEQLVLARAPAAQGEGA
ncbi:MAG: UDP-N-acetylmuramoyl-L-alanine--D-glutamate ligase [Gammaproteobacteria bacterium]